MNISSAIRFIEDKGTPFEKARLQTLLRGLIPGDEILRPLLDTQSKDGGFPSRPKPGNVGSVDSTLTALWKLDESNLIQSEAARRALDFLVNLQRPDGSWDENPALPAFDLAPWIIPGTPATQVYLSAYSTYWLGLSELGRYAPAFKKGLQFLAPLQTTSGKIPGYQHNTWIGTAAFFLAGEPYAGYAQRGLGFMAGLAPGEWEDSQLTWALDCLGRAGVPQDEPFIASGLEQLRARQAEDGCWASEDGPAFIVTATLQALRVFMRYGLET